MKFAELWKLSTKVYKEISFQSIFSLRQGSGLPQSGRRDIKQLVSSARVNTLISKLVTTLFIAMFAFIVFLPVVIGTGGPPMPLEKALPGGVSAFLTVVLFLIVFMGLQVSTSFVSSKIVDVLSPLPLSKNEISQVIFLCFIRIFDIPLVAAGVVFLAVYFFIGGSIFGGFISLVAIGVTEIFALTFTVVSARFFYARVARAAGKSIWHTFLRLVFMLVWILPTFGAYFVVNFAGQIVDFFAYLTQGFSAISHLLVMIYPFSYGFLVSYTSFFHTVDYFTLILSIGSSAAYVAFAFYCLRWVTKTVREIGTGSVIKGTREEVKDTKISPQIPWLGIVAQRFESRFKSAIVREPFPPACGTDNRSGNNLLLIQRYRAEHRAGHFDRHLIDYSSSSSNVVVDRRTGLFLHAASSDGEKDVSHREDLVGNGHLYLLVAGSRSRGICPREGLLIHPCFRNDSCLLSCSGGYA